MIIEDNKKPAEGLFLMCPFFTMKYSISFFRGAGSIWRSREWRTYRRNRVDAAGHAGGLGLLIHLWVAVFKGCMKMNFSRERSNILIPNLTSILCLFGKRRRLRLHIYWRARDIILLPEGQYGTKFPSPLVSSRDSLWSCLPYYVLYFKLFYSANQPIE